MVHLTPEIQRGKLMKELLSLGINERVVNVMNSIPREQFLSRAMMSQAYANDALPIGENQTISQPQVVALMTHALDLQKDHKVLEIGTGCGYQTAILCKCARRIFTIERFSSLSKGAEKRLFNLGLTNFATKVGDGSVGWVEQAPFDRIIVTAASPEAPQSLLDQLKPGGILIIPVGQQSDDYQKLMRYYKREDNTIGEYYIGDVRFVPLIGKEGVKESA